jgi:hypothetical protein
MCDYGYDCDRCTVLTSSLLLFRMRECVVWVVMVCGSTSKFETCVRSWVGRNNGAANVT